MRLIFTIITFALCNILSYSQVTIGSGNPPVEGALLDLKETINATGGGNAQKGLLFPRVFLTVRTALTDISGVNNSDPNARLIHTGLTVYNTNTGFEGGIGLNIWDGTQWNNLQQDPAPNSYLVAFANTSTPLLGVQVALGINWKIIPFKDVKIDSNKEYDSDTGIFKVKNKGSYTFFSHVAFSGISLGDLGLAILVKKSGSSTYSLLGYQNGGILSIGTTRNVNISNIQLDTYDEVVFAINVSTLNLSIASSNDAYIIIKQE